MTPCKDLIRLCRYKTYASENFKKSKPYAKNCPTKTAVIAPSMMFLLYPLNDSVEGYPKERFIEDLVNEVRILVASDCVDTHTSV